MPAHFKRNSTIGLDYGTHSTKVVHRVRGEELGHIVRFDTPSNEYPANASPSAIRELDGCLFFGSRALSLRNGHDYGSLKADLLDQTGDPTLDKQIDVLTVCYLAWALGEIFEQHPQLAADDPVIQISAPTSHDGDKNLSSRYLRIAHACYELVSSGDRINQGVRYAEAAQRIEPILEATIPGRGERKFFVLPETVAPLVSLQMEPFLEKGMYLVADMGAATTEMSVCAVNGELDANSILGYADSTMTQGGDRLAEMESMEIGRSQQKLERFLGEMRKQANRVWAVGFKKDQPNCAAKRRWMSLDVLLTGGATHHEAVRKHFDDKINPIHAWPSGETKLSVGRHEPTTLRCDHGFEEEDLSLFAVANGLSIQGARWPEFYHESDLPRLEPGHSPEEELVPSYLEIG